MPASESTNPIRPVTDSRSLRTRPWEIVSSGLLAAIYVIGVAVALLAMIWLTHRDQRVEQESIQVNKAGRDIRPVGFEADIAPPGLEDTTSLTEDSLAKTLEALTEQASVVAATMRPHQGEFPSWATVEGTDGKPAL